MAVITVRSLPEETHRALRLRAALHGRSTEAEIRLILEEAVRPAGRVRICGSHARYSTFCCRWRSCGEPVGNSRRWRCETWVINQPSIKYP
jgi:plasmid stability protein